MDWMDLYKMFKAQDAVILPVATSNGFATQSLLYLMLLGLHDAICFLTNLRVKNKWQWVKKDKHTDVLALESLVTRARDLHLKP